ncbi:glycosyltransferase family 2 protein [Neopusillimonas aromaticivorans]|uniref:glycosyltransferase family 2 protein n=1 Tax=Neopusillimonas aromaticivorans TaxID=2979868 RepID=UPI0025966B03|nr:glycosyltransferase family 2 protein [Neopusillimonas aromaticivorans]WJJ92877.1 glycosyltransferase family 2 protein [Neopusillimonas aromaticivorans]
MLSQTTESLWNDVWCVIPAFNEATTIRQLVEALLEMCPRVIVVDDCSTDGTAQQLYGLPVKLLSHTTNKGKAASLKNAFTYAASQGAAAVITMDGDGQHDPTDAKRLLALWRARPDHLIIGARLHDQKHFPRARYHANRIACFWISWAAGHAIADTQSGFRVYPAPVIELILRGKVKSSRFTFESEVLIEAARAGTRTLAISIPGHYPRHARPSHFRPVIDITKIILMVASKLLQRGMSPLGLLNSLKPAPIIDPIQPATKPDQQSSSPS